ncbi:MAG: sulfotransferase [Phycisphaerales bacterium]|nr:sulfotransferase [Phycisphaerales bacterium]
MSDIDLRAATDEALEHMRAGNLEKAVDIARGIEEAQPGHPNVFLVRGLVAERRGDVIEALELITSARAAVPERHDLRLHRGRLLATAGRLDDALGEFEIDDWPEHLQVLSARWKAEILSRLMRVSDAIEVLEGLTSRIGERPVLQLIQVRLIHADGRPKEALAVLDSLMAGASVTDAMRIRCLFERARICDETGDYSGAVAAAQKANRMLGATFDADRFQGRMDALISYFDASRFERLPQSTLLSDLPVFLVGMPRSGLRIVEQIIDQHPRGVAGGSQRKLRQSVVSVQQDKGVAFPQCLDQLTPEEVTELGRELLAHFSSWQFAPLRVTNRSLSIEQFLGIVPPLLPGARVIFVRRDPRDLLVSNYLREFSADRAAWAASLQHVGVMIQQHERLVEHWKSVLPNAWHEVQYEELVTDPERITRGLVDFLELEWNDACLRPEESDRMKTYPLYDRIDTPLHSRRSGHWRNYETELGDALASLESDS